MWAVLSRTWHLYFAMTIIVFGVGFQNTILPLTGKSAGFSADMMGYVMSMYFAGFFIGVQLVPRLIKKVGFVRVFATLATVCGSTLVVYGAWENVWLWMIERVLIGMCMSGLYLITETWINDAVDNDNRASALSVYLLVSYFGQMLGQYSVGQSTIGSIIPFVIVSLVISVSFVPVLLSVNPEPKISHAPALSLKATYKASPMGIVGMFFVGIGNAASFVIGGIYAASLGAGVEELSLFLMVGSLGTMLGLYPAGKLSDKYDRRLIIAGLCCVSLTGVFFLSFYTSILLEASLFFGLINMGLGPLYSVCIAQTNDWLDEDQRMPSAARLALIYGTGSIVGSMSLSALMGFFGPIIFIYSQVFIYGGLLCFAVSRFFIREQQVNEEQVNFVPYPTRAVNMAMDVYDDEVFETSHETENEDKDKDKV